MLGVDPYLVSRLGDYRSGAGLEIRFNCPVCAERRHSRGSKDKEWKLYVNFAKGVFHCARCGYGGPVKELYTSLGLQQREEDRPLPQNLKEAIGFSDDFEVREEQEPKKQPVSQGLKIPITTDDWLYSDALEWLQRRFYTVPFDEVKDLVQKGVIRKGTGKYWDRVFFVDIYRGNVRYWTARTILGDVSPKYLNPYGVPRYSVMYNQEALETGQYKEVIVCEGIISAIVAGPNAIATYGRCVTDAQIRILEELPVERFILASEPDHDAKENTLKLAEILTRKRKFTMIVDCPEGTDPADIGRDEFTRMCRERSTPYTWSVGLMRRLSCLT